LPESEARRLLEILMEEEEEYANKRIQKVEQDVDRRLVAIKQ
jgi:hypothetical protein